MKAQRLTFHFAGPLHWRVNGVLSVHQSRTDAVCAVRGNPHVTADWKQVTCNACLSIGRQAEATVEQEALEYIEVIEEEFRKKAKPRDNPDLRACPWCRKPPYTPGTPHACGFLERPKAAKARS